MPRREGILDHDIAYKSLTEISVLIRRKEVSPVEVTQICLERIARWNPQLKAFISVADNALSLARKAESSLLKSGPSALALPGVPISVKDLILTRDLATTAGSRVFGEGLKGTQDALLVKRLRKAGAIIIGKASLHEFAYGVTSDNAHFGAVRNPWQTERLAGGSSGGSAVSVAMGMCYGSIGTDTRGSIRIPASACGITGLKPTRGRVPTRGVLPLSWTLDHAGPMTRSVEDAALLFGILAGTSRQQSQALPAAVALRVGICSYYLDNLDPAAEKSVREAIAVLRQSGVQIDEVEIRFLDEALEASGVIAATEAVAYHEEFIAHRREGYDPAVLKRLEKGFEVSGLRLARALQTREKVTREFARAFKRVDCLLGAVIPAFPPRLGEDFVEIGPAREGVVEQMVRLNSPQNVAGIPAMSVPCGFSAEGLPVGLQIMAGAGQEGKLLALGSHFQKLTDWHLKHPPLATASP